MTGLTFHPAAREEFLAAVDDYEAAAPGLGRRFLVAVREAAALLGAHPNAGSPRSPSARRLVVQGFPFDLIYQVHREGLTILAVAHHRRRPGYWRTRS